MSKGWNSKASDKHFQYNKQSLNRAAQTLINKNFNTKYFSELSTKDSKAMLKKKRTVCIILNKTNIKRIRKKQNELEEDILIYISKLQNKKKYVSRLLVFQYVREKYLLFKGSLTTANYFKLMKT